MSGRTHKQHEQIQIIKAIYSELIIGYIGNNREFESFAKIRDALTVLNDPNIINADIPDDESILLERYVETINSNKQIAIYVDQNLPNIELYNSLLRFAYILQQDIQAESDPAYKLDNEKQSRKLLLKDTDVKAKIVKFPIIKRPPKMSD